MTKKTRAWAAILMTGCLAATALAGGPDSLYSNIKQDETVVFFRTSAWLDESANEWNIPIHGWIFEPQDSAARKALFTQILKSKFDLAPSAETDDNYGYRLNLLIADNERGKRIVIAIGDQHFVLPTSSTNGHFESVVKLSADVADTIAEDDLIRYTAVTQGGETRSFSGESRLLGPSGLSVISDIDDTVKTSNVRDRVSLLEHTFLLDFSAAPGMQQLYSNWAAPNIGFHFVSSSPWQLYPPLAAFFDSHGFPWASFSLKSVRFRDKTLFNLFKDGTQTKPATIEKILETYERRRFVLVGDSGEQDPEVYAALLRKHPEQIVKVYIRNVTQESDNNERFSDLFDGIPRDCWQLFDDPLTLQLPRYTP